MPCTALEFSSGPSNRSCDCDDCMVATMENTNRTKSFNEIDKIVASFLYATVVIVGICGNFIILTSICFRVGARTLQCNILIVSLSLTDFLTSALCGPYYLRSLFVSEFIPGEGSKSSFCIVILAAAYFLAIESILSLALISLDRFLAIRAPFSYQVWVTRRLCTAAVCISWVYSLVIVLPPTVRPGWITYENTPGAPCAFQWAKANTAYVAVNLSVSFAIPAITIFISNILVFKTAREQNRRVMSQIKVGSKEKTANFSQPLNSPRRNTMFTEERDGKALSSPESEQQVKVMYIGNSKTSETNKKLVQGLAGKLDTSQTISGGKLGLTRHLSLEDITRTSHKRDSIENIHLPFILPLKQLYGPEADTTQPNTYSKRKKVLCAKRQFKFNRKLSNKSKARAPARREMKLAMATISLSIAFLLSWTPFVVARILKLSGMSDVSERIVDYSTAIGMLSSAWNPCVLLMTRKEIFSGFKTLLQKLWKKIHKENY